MISNSISETLAGTPPTTTVSNTKYDVNKDGTVDNTDAGLVIDALGTSNAAYDVNGDGAVDFLDVVLVFDNRDDNVAGAPTLFGMKLSAAQIDSIQEQIDLLLATNDRSPAALRTLVYLQQLLVTARPEKTQLLANYPNPFNPETWIPYELAKPTEVTITIYAVTDRWCGRWHSDIKLRVCIKTEVVLRIGMAKTNSVNLSRVACIFNALTAGDFTATRKMLIRK